MADATTPVQVEPQSSVGTAFDDINTAIDDILTKVTALKGSAFMARTGPKMDKLSDDLVEIFTDFETAMAALDTAIVASGIETFADESATVDTATTTGEFFIELIAELADLLHVAQVECLDLNVGYVAYKVGDYYVLTGTIASGPLQRWETLTFDDSTATAILVYGADLSDGADRVIVCRLATGTISAADAVVTGGTSSGTLTFTAGAANQAGGANNRCPGIGGRLKVPSTGAVHAAQTSVPVAYVARGTPAS